MLENALMLRFATIVVFQGMEFGLSFLTEHVILRCFACFSKLSRQGTELGLCANSLIWSVHN